MREEKENLELLLKEETSIHGLQSRSWDPIILETIQMLHRLMNLDGGQPTETEKRIKGMGVFKQMFGEWMKKQGIELDEEGGCPIAVTHWVELLTQESYSIVS